VSERACSCFIKQNHCTSFIVKISSQKNTFNMHLHEHPMPAYNRRGLWQFSVVMWCMASSFTHINTLLIYCTLVVVLRLWNCLVHRFSWMNGTSVMAAFSWYMIWYDTYLLTEIGLTPGGSSTVKHLHLRRWFKTKSDSSRFWWWCIVLGITHLMDFCKSYSV
jgi:hypothetical protein